MYLFKLIIKIIGSKNYTPEYFIEYDASQQYLIISFYNNNGSIQINEKQDLKINKDKLCYYLNVKISKK